jgi:Ca2+-binding RTX toxin-like protein
VKKIYGGGGNDRIYATAAVEAVYGGDGNDKIYTSPDTEGMTAQGGNGDDLLYGHLPASTADEPTASRLVARPTRGSATATASTTDCPTGCYLGIGSDRFDGGPGSDVVYGERGNDVLNGNGGNDRLYSGIGDDILNGGADNDLLSGGFGGDDVDGGPGNDYVRGDATADNILDSGGGNDTLSFATGVTPGFSDGSGYPSFSSYGLPSEGGERGVYVDLSKNIADNGGAPLGGGYDTGLVGTDFENVIGTAFSDYIVGSSASNTIYGGGGGDVILGAEGNDSLFGGADGDRLEGGNGTNTLNGNAGSDYCQNPNQRQKRGVITACERTSGGVVLRDATKISVGQIAPESSYSHLYLVGSSAVDSVSATYAPGSPATVTFSVGPGSAGLFDSSPSAAGGCGTASATQVVCALSKPLDAIVVAGMGADDSLQTDSFQTSSSVVITGGEGNDTLSSAGALSEDVLVDGPGGGNDTLNAFERDDALQNNDGADQLFGGDGNDRFLSTTICDGDTVNGGAGVNNVSWAKFKATGIEARIGDGVSDGTAGRPGSGAGPVCGSGEALDHLQQIQDLEGSPLSDTLYGGPGPNQLLGRAGSDALYGLGGIDLLLTNSGDFDPVIDCGADPDKAVIDHPDYGESPIDCETLQEADPQYTG